MEAEKNLVSKVLWNAKVNASMNRIEIEFLQHMGNWHVVGLNLKNVFSLWESLSRSDGEKNPCAFTGQ